MGLPQKLGLLAQSVQQDTSLNIGIGGAANASFKLQVTGTTNLTGALSGTSATFSSAMRSNGVEITNSANADILDIFQSPSALNSFIDYPSGRSLILRNKGSLGGLTLASTGAATFSSSVKVPSSSTGGLFEMGSGANANSRSFRLASDVNDWGDFGIQVSNSQTGTTYTNALLINRSGNVGIGTSSPARKLDVFSDGAQFGDGGSFTFYMNVGSGAATGVTWVVNGTDRMRINTQGYLKASNNGTYNNATGTFHELVQSDIGSVALRIIATNTGYYDAVQQNSCNRTNNSAYALASFYTNGFNDLEFNLRGDGNAFADGSWQGGGADYAEYFEWYDGNPNNEDRRGYSVSLIDNKIKIAEQNDKIIGIISGNPSVIGDSAWNMWTEKYLRDDFGTYVRDENGDRILNPNYNPDSEYIPRENRPEWGIVGLMGKLCMRKGQPTMPNWIKMKDISDNVEQWLIK